jgi:alpha-beta hydrolase superfamily lysophospholipase
LTDNTYSEEVIQFGNNNVLIGIITKPDNIDSLKPAALILNSGVLHRTGACRNSVHLARALGNAGFISFRFDYYGIGDSGFGGAIEHDALLGKQEIFDAMDELEQRLGSLKFVVHGLCSGARDAFSSALHDQRIIAISQIDSYSYQNKGYLLRRLLSFLTRPSAWLNAIKIRLLDQSKTSPLEDSSSTFETKVWPKYPPKQEIEQAYQKLVDKKAKMLIVYTGSWDDTYNYENQFYDLFSSVQFGDLVTLKYMPNANHVMTDESDRYQFINAFKQFAQSL